MTCDWPVNYAACSSCRDYLAELDPDTRATFEQMAGDLLYEWTDRRFGLCEVTIRPCSSSCEGAARWRSTFWGNGPYPWGGGNVGPWTPALIGGQWFNVGCGCASTCSCGVSGAAVLRLPGPIAEVSRVTIDGVDLDPAEYSVLYGEVLVRNDGSRWPACQDLLAPATQPGTFEIVYTRGTPVPLGGQVAAARLASELAMAACDDDDCALPERIQSITRQGVTASFALSGEKWYETGIWAIDTWVASVRQPRSRPSVRSVDIPARRGSRITGLR